MEIRALQKAGNSYSLTIPRSYLVELCWQPRDHLVLEIADGALVVRTLEQHFAHLRQVKELNPNAR